MLRFNKIWQNFLNLGFYDVYWVPYMRTVFSNVHLLAWGYVCDLRSHIFSDFSTGNSFFWVLKFEICLLGTPNIGISALIQFSTHNHHFTEFDLVLRVRCYIILTKVPGRCTVCGSYFLYGTLWQVFTPSVYVSVYKESIPEFPV